MIEQLISKVFASRNAAHIAHWKEKSGFRHETLGAFYDEVIDAIDMLVEAYQGAFDLVGDIPSAKKVNDDILAQLMLDARWIEEHHEDVCKGNRAIANLIDALSGVYLSAIYKLRNLK